MWGYVKDIPEKSMTRKAQRGYRKFACRRCSGKPGLPNFISSPKDSRKDHRRSLFCVMIQVLRLHQTQRNGGDLFVNLPGQRNSHDPTARISRVWRRGLISDQTPRCLFLDRYAGTKCPRRDAVAVVDAVLRERRALDRISSPGRRACGCSPGYLPLNSGGRFSLNALPPSLISAVAKTWL